MSGYCEACEGTGLDGNQDVCEVCGGHCRTPIQRAAKELYDALDKAQQLAGVLIEVSGHKQELYSVEHDIERAFDNFVNLLHKDDCK